MMKYSRLGASIRTKKFCVLSTAKSRGKIWQYFYFANGLVKLPHETLRRSLMGMLILNLSFRSRT